MWGKILLLVLVLMMLGFSLYFLYQNLPGPEEKLLQITNVGEETENPIVEYGTIKQFYSNMRFNHNKLSYFIENSCEEQRKERMEEAFVIFSNKTSLISFYPQEESKADILVGCSEDFIEPEENLFIAGEGGPTKIINTSLYNVIVQGKILLYKEGECEFPVVEVHELLHVFGFDHIENPKDIMYNFSSCDQEIGQDTIDILNSLYSQVPAPDLYISNISATKRGRYLDFEIEVRNRGLIDVENATFLVSASQEKVGEFSLEEIGYGEGKILKVQNLKLPSRSTESVKFILDAENKIKELMESNNEIELAIE